MTALIKKYPVTFFFFFAYLINWLGLLGAVYGVIPTFGEWPMAYEGHEVARLRVRRTLLNWAPNFAAIIVLAVLEGRRSLKSLFSQFLVWRVSLRWWLFSVAFPIIVSAMVAGLYMLKCGRLNLNAAEHLPMVFLLRNIFSLSTGGFGEEAGWRGFALPRLEKRLGPLSASVVIGLAWGFWHTPSWLVRGFDKAYLLYFALSIIGLSIFLTWLYHTTKESLLIVAIVHNLFNAVIATVSYGFTAIIPNEYFMPFFAIVMIFVSLVLIFATQGRLGLDGGDERNRVEGQKVKIP